MPKNGKPIRRIRMWGPMPYTGRLVLDMVYGESGDKATIRSRYIQPDDPIVNKIHKFVDDAVLHNQAWMYPWCGGLMGWTATRKE